ncbi:hypothetical protein [Burkholderia oklahomensis]|uniref:hypothetical protein n=1 Tax=Burkholderia oklahomensis TaxID=342113 RepID=UPI00016A2B39|nr:hypothetical protein [Burkholderia oklahomensis]
MNKKRGPATRGRRARIAATFCPGSVRRARFEKTIPIKLRYSRNRQQKQRDADPPRGAMPAARGRDAAHGPRRGNAPKARHDRCDIHGVRATRRDRARDRRASPSRTIASNRIRRCRFPFSRRARAPHRRLPAAARA